MIPQARRALINHVLARCNLSHRFDAAFDLEPYLRVLPRGQGDRSAVLEDPLTALPGNPRMSNSALKELLDKFDAEITQGAEELLRQAQTLPDPADAFGAWSSLIEVGTRSTLGTRGENGVAISHEFKLLSALVHATDAKPDQLDHGFLLVSGDFPGIQRVIYTISSDGATKGVRGRSFFLQLLGECVVRRILYPLNLPLTNALIIAGGRFRLLLPPNTENMVNEVYHQINENLLDLFDGDLSLVLAVQPLEREALNDRDKLKQSLKSLRERELSQKVQPFATVSPERLLKPYGAGSQYFCAISRREPRDNEIKEAQETYQAYDRGETDRRWISKEHLGFEILAQHLAQVGQGGDNALIFTSSKPDNLSKSWQDALYPDVLHQITGWSVLLASDITDRLSVMQKLPDVEIVELNNISFSGRFNGTRFAAVHTPRVTSEDIRQWKDKYPGKEIPFNVKEIRDFSLLASRGEKSTFARLGVLRMDIDNLGKIFDSEDRPSSLTLTQQIGVSGGLSVFFEAYLPKICQFIETKLNRPESLYLLYGGGDDLFIVGEWEVIPELAQLIHDLLDVYSRGRLSVSAGIVLIPAHFPFYVAAELARNALDDHAKEYKRGSDVKATKDAVSWLGRVYGWRDGEGWQRLNERREALEEAYKLDERKSLIHNVLQIYELWRKDYEDYGDAFFKYGPFQWLTVYQFSRIMEGLQGKPYLQSKLKLLRDDVVKDIEISGSAARWAELVLRNRDKAEQAEDEVEQNQ